MWSLFAVQCFQGILKTFINSSFFIFLSNQKNQCMTHFSSTLLLFVPRWAGDNTDLPSNSNISKTVRVNIVFTTKFSKEYSTSFVMVCRLVDFVLVVLKLFMFEDSGIIGISKNEFFNFSDTVRAKQNEKYLKTIPSK